MLVCGPSAGHEQTPWKSAGGGIRTHEPLRDGSLSPTPLTMLGDPRTEGRPPSGILKALLGQQAFNDYGARVANVPA